MKVSRRDLLRMPLVQPLAALAQRKNASPNVLMIAVDDLNTRIGCYGDPLVKTPNIDRLAQHGVRFEHAYCNYPLCNPSRTSLLSGVRPERTRVMDNTVQPRTHLGDDALFLPEYFKAHGYFTARVGKVAHFEQAVSWDVSENEAGRPAPQPAQRHTQVVAPRPLTGGVGGLIWNPTDNPDEKEQDGAMARRVAQLITENKDKPFFITAGFHKPHLPLVAPHKYFDMYKLEDIQLPKTPANDRHDIPRTALICTNRDDLTSDEERRKVILAYYAATSFMDAQLGVLLDTMDRHKLWDNTVVLLWADHGWHLFEHGLWGKITEFEESTHTPLIVHAPGKLSGAVSPRLVEWVDIYPTVAELCGLSRPAGLDGSSFVPLMSDPQRPWKKAAYTLVWRGGDHYGRSVRTERYRYTEWNDGAEGAELYDHQTDRHEWTNLAGDAKLAGTRKELQELLRNGQKGNLPPGV